MDDQRRVAHEAAKLKAAKPRVSVVRELSVAMHCKRADAIASEFSKFLGKKKPFGTVLDLKVCIAGQPGTECEFDPAQMEDVTALFSWRHEWVHDPLQQAAKDETC